MLRSDGIERSGLLVFDDCLDKFSSILNILAAGGLKQFQFVDFLLVFRVVHIKALKQFPAIDRTVPLFEPGEKFQGLLIGFGFFPGSSLSALPYFNPIAIRAPVTAPQVICLRAIPPPKAAPILRQSSSDRPKSRAVEAKTAWEQLNPLLK